MKELFILIHNGFQPCLNYFHEQGLDKYLKFDEEGNPIGLNFSLVYTNGNFAHLVAASDEWEDFKNLESEHFTYLAVADKSPESQLMYDIIFEDEDRANAYRKAVLGNSKVNTWT